MTMKQLLETTRLMLPARGWLFVYWSAASVLMLLISLGLKSTDENHAALWGLRLNGFGLSSSVAIQNAYLEMMRHVWLLLTLPIACFIGSRKILDTFRNDFRQFLRFGQRSCLFMEAARLSALAGVLVSLIGPFAIGAIWGLMRPGIEFAAVRDGLVSCAMPTLFVTFLIYFLVSLRVPQDIVKGCGLVMPFFLSGLAYFLDKQQWRSVGAFVPFGLPYDFTRWNDSHLRAGIIFCGLVVLARLVFATTAGRPGSRTVPSPSTSISSLHSNEERA
jgi:hypothetical protein